MASPSRGLRFWQASRSQSTQEPDVAMSVPRPSESQRVPGAWGHVTGPARPLECAARPWQPWHKACAMRHANAPRADDVDPRRGPGAEGPGLEHWPTHEASLASSPTCLGTFIGRMGPGCFGMAQERPVCDGSRPAITSVAGTGSRLELRMSKLAQDASPDVLDSASSVFKEHSDVRRMPRPTRSSPRSRKAPTWRLQPLLTQSMPETLRRVQEQKCRHRLNRLVCICVARATHAQRMRNACATHAQRMRNACATHAQRMRNACVFLSELSGAPPAAWELAVPGRGASAIGGPSHGDWSGPVPATLRGAMHYYESHAQHRTHVSGQDSHPKPQFTDSTSVQAEIQALPRVQFGHPEAPEDAELPSPRCIWQYFTCAFPGELLLHLP